MGTNSSPSSLLPFGGIIVFDPILQIHVDLRSISMDNIPLSDYLPLHQGGQGVTLEVMNPRGILEPPPPQPPTHRLNDLAGHTIGLYWNGKPGADNFMDALAEQLTDRFVDARFLRLDGNLDPGDAGAAELAEQADAFIYGVGD